MTLINTVTAGEQKEESNLTLLNFAVHYQLPINIGGNMVAAIGILALPVLFI